MAVALRNLELAESRKLAQEHKDAGNLDEAVSEHDRLAEAWSSKGRASIEALGVLLELADVYQIQNRLLDSIVMYREVLVGREEIFVPSALETLQTVHNLAKVLEEKEECGEAEICHRCAMSGFEELGVHGLRDRLNCQTFLADMLSDLGRLEEARQLLVSTLAGDGFLDLPHQRILVLGSLLEVYGKMPLVDNLSESILDMRKLS